MGYEQSLQKQMSIQNYLNSITSIMLIEVLLKLFCRYTTAATHL
jgi:hypothetical protein